MTRPAVRLALTTTVLAAVLPLLAWRADPAGSATPRPPLVKGEKPWAATWSNPVNRNLIRIAICETGGINGGRPLWTHHNSTYSGALGFAHSTWSYYRRFVRPLPGPVAAQATPAEQLAVGRVLVRIWPNYSSWPACSRRLGLR